MSYVESKLKAALDDEFFRIYVSDSLYYYCQGKGLSKRYSEYLNPAKQDNRSGEEIAADFIARHGLKVVS